MFRFAFFAAFVRNPWCVFSRPTRAADADGEVRQTQAARLRDGTYITQGKQRQSMYKYEHGALLGRVLPQQRCSRECTSTAVLRHAVRYGVAGGE